MNPVEDFIYEKEGKQREILILLHDLLTNDFDLQPKIRYKIPFYYRKSWVCYLNPLKDGGVDFAMIRGNELSNEQGLLDSHGRKQIWSVHFHDIEKIPLKTIFEILQEAIILDENVPYKLRRKRK